MTEQPAPIANDRPPAWPLVIADLRAVYPIPVGAMVASDAAARDDLGLRRYGVRLASGNGRDSLRDAYEEALDLAVYLRNSIEESEARDGGASLLPHYQTALALCCAIRGELFTRDGK